MRTLHCAGSLGFQTVLDRLSVTPGSVIIRNEDFPLVSEATVVAAVRLHQETGGMPVISVREAAHHPWRAFDLTDPQAPTHLLDSSDIQRGRRQDMPAVYEPVTAVIVIRGEDLTRHRELYTAGGFRPLRLSQTEALRLDGPIERAILAELGSSTPA